jgi:hypothetical protein
MFCALGRFLLGCLAVVYRALPVLAGPICHPSHKHCFVPVYASVRQGSGGRVHFVSSRCCMPASGCACCVVVVLCSALYPSQVQLPLACTGGFRFALLSPMVLRFATVGFTSSMVAAVQPAVHALCLCAVLARCVTYRSGLCPPLWLSPTLCSPAALGAHCCGFINCFWLLFTYCTLHVLCILSAAALLLPPIFNAQGLPLPPSAHGPVFIFL